ncbi:MAG: flagellar biosynthesis protein FlhF [Candidatus Lernaella stagnicola]|nr:flagellar biosynthesis protein FlhF [Candidatus Lernaella stagnicola]
MAQVQTFVVENVRDGITRVKRTLGPDAVILSIRSVKDRRGKTALEVTASLDERPTPSVEAAVREPEVPQVPRPENGAEIKQIAGRSVNEIMAELHVITRRLEEIQGQLQPDSLNEKLEGFAKGLTSLQRMVVDSTGGSRRGALPYDPDLAVYYEKLLEEGVDAAYAQELIEQTSRRLSSKSLSVSVYGMEYLAAVLMDRVRTATPFHPGRDQHIHMIVGPTGVGKTTTIAKLAAQQVFEFGHRVALLTVDTFRIGAIDQLRTYAKIINVPIEVCMNEVDLIENVRKHADKDVLFIDTAGASQKDARMMGELAKVYETGVPMDVHLIVSATTHDADLSDIADRYGVFPLTSLIVSKLDEANNFGNVYNLMQQTNLPVSCFTVGQHVPDDIEGATSERVADLLLNVTANT